MADDCGSATVGIISELVYFDGTAFFNESIDAFTGQSREKVIDLFGDFRVESARHAAWHRSEA
jgi:hypothetical protein